MSLAAKPMEVVQIVDKRVDFRPHALPVREGCGNVAYLQATATSLGSSVQFDVTPPNPTSNVLSRDMLIANTVTLNIAVPVGGAASLIKIGSYDAPRAFPWSSCVDAMTLRLNGQSFSVNQWSEIGHVLRRCNPKSAFYKLGNKAPWFPDQGSDYPALLTSTRNVLSAAAAGDYDMYRGAYTRVVASNVTPTTATVTITTFEPVCLDPIMYASDQAGIPYVQSFGLTFNMGNYARMLSHAFDATTADFTNAQVSAVHNSSTMYYQSIAQPLLGDKMPAQISFPFHAVNTNVSPAQAVVQVAPAAGPIAAGTNLTSPVITYNTIPNRIYVFAAPAAAARQASTSDFTLQYTGGLQVQWGSRSGLMTGVPRETLYDHAREAGVDLPFEQWDGRYRLNAVGAAVGAAPAIVGGSGSILCLRPAVHWPLEVGEAQGSSGSYQFQVSASFANQCGVNFPACSLYVVAITGGVITMDSGFGCRVEVGALNLSDVLDARPERISEAEATGSGFFDVIRSAIPMLKKVGKLAHTGLSAANSAGLLGDGAMAGGSANFLGGSALSGGKMLSQKSLAARLR
ncbi:MAG: hypothetical protein Q7U97_04265 [Rhodocyclaceae bacterium]|nr:hypothetical protein [Rhodocyclaceae bacterium]